MSCCYQITYQVPDGEHVTINIYPTGYDASGNPIFLFNIIEYAGVHFFIQYLNISPFGAGWYIGTTGPSGDIIAFWEWFEGPQDCLSNENGGFTQDIENYFSSFSIQPIECLPYEEGDCNCSISYGNKCLGYYVEFWNFGLINGRKYFKKVIGTDVFEIYWDGGQWVFAVNGAISDTFEFNVECPLSSDTQNWFSAQNPLCGTYTKVLDCLKCPCLRICYGEGRDIFCIDVERLMDSNGNPFWSWIDPNDNSEWIIELQEYNNNVTYIIFRDGTPIGEYTGTEQCPLGRSGVQWFLYDIYGEDFRFDTQAVDCPPRRIFARSPYIVEIDVAGSSETRVDLYIWQGEYQDIPGSPQYVLSKKVPATNQTRTLYNIAPYILEYIQNTIQPIWDNVIPATIDQWCHVRIVRYYNNNVLIDFRDYYAYEGYGYFQNGYNPDLGAIHLDQGTYQYHSNLVSTALGDLPNYYPTNFKIESGLDYAIEYINIVTNVSTGLNALNFDEIYNAVSVIETNFEQGNIVRIYKDGIPIWESKFVPVNECKYEVIPIDFVNRYGSWQREYFFKASKQNITTTRTEFAFLNANPFPPYNTNLPTKKHMNINGAQRTMVNTGWVDESFGDIVTQILLSERIYIDNEPHKVVTESFEKFKNLNNKTINYQLEFETAFNILNYNV
jgi:hypothetical protein